MFLLIQKERGCLVKSIAALLAQSITTVQPFVPGATIGGECIMGTPATALEAGADHFH